ncbi:hypothetical protein [Kiloniella litopenaei]|nr:hypothetical protein [Kiloniella litopenaei]
MQGEIDQLLVLSSAVNAMALEVVSTSPLPKKLPAAQAKRLRYADDLTFVDLYEKSDNSLKEQIRFTKLSDWLDDLRHRKVSAAWLVRQPREQTDTDTTNTDGYHPPEHMQMAFAGGTKSWSLITSGPGFTEEWKTDWQLNGKGKHDPNKHAPDKHNRGQEKQEPPVWQVRYGCIRKTDRETPRPAVNLAQETVRLEKILQEIAILAGRLGYDNWPAVFAKALDALVGKPGTSLHPNLRPPYYAAYPKEAHRLLAAAYNGWVFGGMGSWNDVVFSTLEDQATYDRLTPELYQAICHAIVGISCSFRKQ